MRGVARALVGLLVVIAVAFVAVRSCAWVSKSFSFWDRRGTIDVVGFDPRGRWIAIGGRDVGTGGQKDHGDVKLRDLKTGTLLHRFAVPERVWNLAVNPSGTLLAVYAPVTGDAARLSVLKISDGAEPVRVHEQMLAFLPADAFSFVGDHFVAAGNKQLMIWRCSDWTATRSLQAYTKGLAWDPSSGVIAFSSLIDGIDGVTCVNVDTAAPRRLPGAGIPLAFLPDGALVTTLSANAGGLAVWPPSDGAPYRPWPESNGHWAGAGVCKASQSLVAWREDGTIQIWKTDAKDAAPTRTFSVVGVRDVVVTGDPDVIVLLIERQVTVERLPDGGSRATSEVPGGVALWSVSRGKCLYQFNYRARMALQGSILTTYDPGGEEVSVWSIANPAQPSLLWQDRWRDGSASLVPLPE